MTTELEKLMDILQASDTDIDTAMKTYDKAAKLIEEMETYLEKAENKVSKIKANLKGNK